MAKPRLKKGRVIMTFALTVGTIVAADSLRRDFFVKPDTTIVVSGNFKGSSTDPSANFSDPSVMGSNTQQTATGISYLGYSELAVPSSQISSGLLTIINASHPASAEDNSSALVKLSEEKNECYSLRNDDLVLNQEAADALNQLMQAYNNATGLSDFVVYSTTQPYTYDDSIYPTSYPESVTGYTVDIAINGSSSVIAYDGNDEQSWLIENCADYGFILRYPKDKTSATGQDYCPWHLRYVGKPHAAVMAQNNLCLEEYVDFLRAYKLNTAPLTCEADGVQYEIYFTGSMGDSTSVRVPISGNYTISGNNIDGFILTAVK
ncbi:MAG: M15 family metallopeptidase [Ruminococcus sp.]|nr:M15 family metallopeptidase [Ruminococcus sp.]